MADGATPSAGDQCGSLRRNVLNSKLDTLLRYACSRFEPIVAGAHCCETNSTI
jgi:hypothetical protein